VRKPTEVRRAPGDLEEKLREQQRQQQTNAARGDDFDDEFEDDDEVADDLSEKSSAQRAGKARRGRQERLANRRAAGEAQVALDRVRYQARAERLFQRLKDEASQTAQARWACLLALLDELESLVTDLQAAGDGAPPVAHLAEVVRHLHGAKIASPGEAAIHAWWKEVWEALEAWLRLSAPDGGTGDRRERFWK
jgi:hypothetical protein